MQGFKFSKQLIAGCIATLTMMCPGFHLAWSATSLSKLMAEDTDIIITSDESSWIVSVYSFGGVFGPFIGATLVDLYGRKLSLLSVVIPCIISSILIGVAQNYWWFIFARFIAGLAIGVTYIALPMYLGEIADDRTRGAIGILLNVMTNVGILLTYCVGPWVSRAALAALGGAFPLIFGLMFVWMPESPYYLIMKDKPERAEESLLWLRGTRSVTDELRKVQESVEFDKKNAGSMKDLLLIPGNRKALLTLLGLVLAQNFSGYIAILAYAGLIFEASGSTLNSNTSVIIIGVVQLFSCLLTVFTVDLAGRRPLLLTSGCGTILFLIGEALYFYLQAIGANVSSISWLPVTAIVGYIIFFAMGLGSVPFVVLSEIFPCNVKALATTICTVGSALLGILVTKFYQIIADAFGIHVILLGFAALTVCTSITTYFTLPETKQKSLKSIQEEFHKSIKTEVEAVKS